MAQEFFRPGATVEVTLREFPLAEDDEDLIVEGSVIERDATGLLLDTGVEEDGRLYIPWSNISQVLGVEPDDDEELLP